MISKYGNLLHFYGQEYFEMDRKNLRDQAQHHFQTSIDMTNQILSQGYFVDEEAAVLVQFNKSSKG